MNHLCDSSLSTNNGYDLDDDFQLFDDETTNTTNFTNTTNIKSKTCNIFTRLWNFVNLVVSLWLTDLDVYEVKKELVNYTEKDYINRYYIDKDYIKNYVYSFSLNPTNYQPSGCINASRYKNIYLVLDNSKASYSSQANASKKEINYVAE